jgi:hypothetical protein
MYYILWNDKDTIMKCTIFCDTMNARLWNVQCSVMDKGTIMKCTIFCETIKTRLWNVQYSVMDKGTIMKSTIFCDSCIHRITEYCTFHNRVFVIFTLLWYCGQSSWLQIQTPGFDSRRYQILWEVAALEQGPRKHFSRSISFLPMKQRAKRKLRFE